MDNPWSRSLQDEAVLSFSIGHGASLTPPSQDHYRDWVLYLDDVTLPLSQAIVARRGGGPQATKTKEEWRSLYQAVKPFLGEAK